MDIARRIHNPRNRTCGCDPDCWCNRTAIGRTVKWWFPARYFGLHHKNREIEDLKRNGADVAEWKRERDNP